LKWWWLTCVEVDCIERNVPNLCYQLWFLLNHCNKRVIRFVALNYNKLIKGKYQILIYTAVSQLTEIQVMSNCGILTLEEIGSNFCSDLCWETKIYSFVIVITYTVQNVNKDMFDLCGHNITQHNSMLNCAKVE
jgi:hypothetical protein